MNDKTIPSHNCTRCQTSTKHAIEASFTQTGSDDYSFKNIFYIVRCLGCDTVSFRDEFHDLENHYPTSNPITGKEEWEYPLTIKSYPKSISGHTAFQESWKLPKIVKTIYEETIIALQEQTGLLGSLGLRAIIEAICNDLKITSSDLNKRINALAKQGYISINDSRLLHSIRFMGNDAAHKIKLPKNASLTVALSIIEHLLESIYIFPEHAKKHFETTIDSYERFLDLVKENLKNIEKNEEVPIAKILGKNMRRLLELGKNMEEKLITDIKEGKFTELKLGIVDIYAGSKEKLQHFIKT